MAQAGEADGPAAGVIEEAGTVSEEDRCDQHEDFVEFAGLDALLGDVRAATQYPEEYMLLCGSANRAKSWSCEHCVNWLELKKPEVCRSCYWAYPENYTHIAMRQVRRADIMWTEAEVGTYEKLKQKTIQLQKNIPGYVKEIVEQHLRSPESH